MRWREDIGLLRNGSGGRRTGRGKAASRQARRGAGARARWLSALSSPLAGDGRDRLSRIASASVHLGAWRDVVVGLDAELTITNV